MQGVGVCYSGTKDLPRFLSNSGNFAIQSCNPHPLICTLLCTHPKWQSPPGETMLWLILLVLLIAWILGFAGAYPIGAIFWLLLVAAIIVLVIQLVGGRRPVP